MKLTTTIFLTCMLAIGIMGCYNDNRTVIYPDPNNNTGCDTSNVTYSGTIQPIIAQNCSTSGCHDADFIAGGYNMTTYDGFLHAVQSGKLIGSIKHESGYIAMPQSGGFLSDCQINQIVAWVNAGAQNN